MKSGWCWLAVASACFCAGAETVAVNAEPGKAKTDFVVRRGADAVEVNAAATAGTVRLSGVNEHTGGTTLNGGTLDVRTAADGVNPADTGTGTLTLKGGNFRYAGPSGAEWKGAIDNAAKNGTAVNWQVDSDLTVSGPVTSPSGAFVKTGAGTLTLTQPFTLAGGTAVDDSKVRKQMADLSPDHAPTKGFSNVTFLEGTTVVESPYGDVQVAPTTNVLSSAGYMQIGGYTTVDGEEKGAVLEIRGGVSYTGTTLNIGQNNGKVGQAGEPPVSGLRVTGGRLLIGPKGENSIYMGSSTVGGKNRAHAFLDVSTTNRVLCQGLYICNNQDSVCDIDVHDGGYLYALNGHYITANSAVTAASTNNLSISGAGSWISFQNFQNDKSNSGMTTNIRLADDAVMEMRNFTNTSKGKLNLVFDGGVWRHRNHNSSTPHWPASITSAKVGPGGLIVYFNDGNEAYPVIWDKGIEPLDDSGTDGGVSFTQGANRPQLLIRAVNTYRGRTEIDKIRVELGGAGRLPETTALKVGTNNGGLLVSNGVQRVGTLLFGNRGRTSAATSPMLGFTKDSRLDVAGEVKTGLLAAPKLWLFEQAGPTNAAANGLVSRGVYTFVTAPVAYRGALEEIAAHFVFPYKPDAVDYRATVVADGDRAELRVEVTDAGSPGAAPGRVLALQTVDGDPVLTPAAEQVAAAGTIVVNGAAETGAGTVDLGALAGFAPGGYLHVGSGRTQVSDLSFATVPDNLVLGSGTLRYAGASALIPGFTVDSGAYSAVLDIPGPETALTVTNMTALGGALTKMGAGTLHLGGSGPIVLPRNTHDNGTGNGVAANGDSPTTGFRAVNVNGGVLSIGTVGDPEDAPDVLAPNDFSVGSQSHRAGQGVQTAGALEMNNGSLFVSNYCYIGYYSGCEAAWTEKIFPRIVQRGGYMRTGMLRLYQDGNSAKTSKACPSLEILGGTNEVATSLTVGYQAAPAGFDGRLNVTVSGGLLRVGTQVYSGYANGSPAADFTITDEGRVEVGDVFYPAYGNKTHTSTFRLRNGGTLRSRGIDGRGTGYLVEALFDGGVYEPVAGATANAKITNLALARIGAGGLVVDLSHERDQVSDTMQWFNLQQTFVTDPALNGAPDGGIVLKGAGTALTWTGFDASTFTGGILVKEGARFIPARNNNPTSGCPVTVKPTAILSEYNSAGTPNEIDSLTLGEAGATEPTFLELRGGGKNELGIVVKNAMSVESPVVVRTRPDDHDLVPAFEPGVYTALVYSAANADVDLAKFIAPSGTANGTLAVRQETIAMGAYAGYKAVVVTISAGAPSAIPTWTAATDGGTWSTAANWQDGQVAPNGPASGVLFEPATKAGVPVTLDAPVALGALRFDASGAKYGYTLSGSTLTLDAGEAWAEVVNARGTNAIASATTVSGNVRVRAEKGSEFRLSSVAGDGVLQLNDASTNTEGQVTPHVEPSFDGTVRTGGGRVVLDDLSFAKQEGQLVLGPGTLLYTGDAAAVAEIAVAAGTGRAAILEHAADVTTDALTVSGTSAFIKRGAGDLRVHGTGTFAPNTNVGNSSDNAVQANGDSPHKGLRGFGVATGRVLWGEPDDAGNAPVLDLGSNEITIGAATSQGDAAFVLNNGEMKNSNATYLGYYGKSLTPRATYSLVLNGGTFTAKSIICAYNWTSAVNMNTEVVVNDGANGYVSSDVILNRNHASKPAEQFCRWTQNGGVFGVKGSFHTCYWMTNQSARGIVDLNGGLLAVTGTITFARSGKNTENNEVRFSLNGGARLEANAITQTVAAANTCFYGNGGALAPIGQTVAGECFGAVGHLYATTNGLVVDTSILAAKGKSYLVALPVEHDPEAPAVDGGVAKLGPGLLRLAGANTFTGPLTMGGGTVRLEGDAAGTLPALAFAGGTLDTSAPLAAGSVSGSGLCLGSLTVTGSLAPAVDGVVNIAGDLTLAPGAKVDLSTFPAGSLAYGDRIALAVVSGTADVPARLSVTDGSAAAHEKGQKFSLRTAVVDGVVHGTLTSGGTVLLFR